MGEAGAPGDWLDEARTAIADLGFVVRDGERPGTKPGPRLFVELREHPTERHFDPETVSFWEARDGRGTPVTVDRRLGAPVERPFSWGRIAITDRLKVSNEFLAFGGTLRAASLQDGTLVLAFTSPGPILRWSGHSQGTDPFTDEVGAFFGRLKVPIDFRPGAEERITDATPEALYAAMVGDARDRLARSRQLERYEQDWARFVEHESRRLAADAEPEWLAGEQLRSELELGPTPPA